MPRNSWMSLLDGEGAAVAPALPAELAALQEERAALTARMARLTGSVPAESGEATGRFPVTPLAVRRAADDAWARSRDRVTGVDLAEPPLRPLAGRVAGTLTAGTGGARDEPMARTGQRLIHAPLERALAEPLAARAQGRPLADPLPAARGFATEVEERLAPVTDRPLPDRRSAREQLSARDGLAAPAPTERYEARRARLLSVISGGSGDLDARAARARVSGLKARAAARQMQAADDARLDLARSRARDREGDLT